MKSKKVIIILSCTIGAALVFCGCTKPEDKIKNEIQQRAMQEIEATEEYQQYIQYRERELLDENDTYNLALLPEDIQSGIPVSIAKNTFLNCTYNINNENDLPKETDVCYLMPGDSLYISSVTVTNSLSNLYDFSKFNIWSYDAEGNREDNLFSEVKTQNGLLLTIPQDYSGSGFSIEPIGLYTNRFIFANSYFINSSGKKQTLEGGTWTIDNLKSQSFKDSISISPVDSYSVTYDYSKYSDYYYFESSDPQCWYLNENDCKVIFSEHSPNDENMNYSVEMHPYITMTVNNECTSFADNVISFVSKNGKDSIITAIVKDNESLLPEKSNEKSFTISKLKVEDTITVRVGEDYKVTSEDVNIGNPVPLENGADNEYEYTFFVPDTTEGIQINVSKRNSEKDSIYVKPNVKNGDLLLYREDNSEVKNGDELPADSEKVRVEIVPDEGYYITGANVENYSRYSKIMKYEKFDSKTIVEEHPIIQYVQIELENEDKYGTCIYKLDGKVISENKIKAMENQTIELTFTPNNNYKIVRDSKLIEKWSELTKNKSVSDKIKVTQQLNGKVISHSDFNINIVEVE